MSVGILVFSVNCKVQKISREFRYGVDVSLEQLTNKQTNRSIAEFILFQYRLQWYDHLDWAEYVHHAKKKKLFQ